jgi:hypothetical protein
MTIALLLANTVKAAERLVTLSASFQQTGGEEK